MVAYYIELQKQHQDKIMLNQTEPDKLVDHQRCPYFLWDVELNLEQFRALLGDPNPRIRAYWAGKLMRQAKPDDIFLFLSLADIRQLWPDVQPYLGKTRAFWQWLLLQWKVISDE
jgi:hypothetical protein